MKKTCLAALAIAAACAAQAQLMTQSEIEEKLAGPELPRGIAANNFGAKAIRPGAPRPDPVSRLCEPRPASMPADNQVFRNLVVGNAPSVNLSVEFDFGKSTLRREGEAQLDALAGALKGERLAKMSFGVSGHTDAVGREDENDVLSCERALMAKKYLVLRGVAPERLVAMGFGFRELIVPSDPKAAANRRVEIKVLK